MLPALYREVLLLIEERLRDIPHPWVITGSLGMVLQGLPLDIHDIDIQTNAEGAYEIEARLSEYVTRPVEYIRSERIRSHLGACMIDTVKVEMMGAIQKRLPDGTWEPPVDVTPHRCWITLDGRKIPVLSLEYEYHAYRTLGRLERAAVIREWLETHPPTCR
ncbi:nucleotidyltransferase domain-containing protein [Spirochaeta thermophila]|uniref:Uncharacterized protein n=1 Tax=Winmispira thermophila (strain ATCC 49972 / DSM 6192 / RI 19.B1) TaxID=665571 RepID=E0RSV4_WINT6|nr:hypothetical protein [Spirochaeta thermophila]ADN02091.1 hypothetical protein STHERM_c11460 [Spirochaeta thermophila DSM 6192]